MDFLFHKTGALRGKPRGYAFVQYASKDVSSLPSFPQSSRADPGYFYLHHDASHVHVHG